MITTNEYHLNRICCEDISLIENYYDAIKDNTQVWDCHHKNEITLNKSVKELKTLGLYYNRPANELIFLTHSDHISIHREGKTPWNKNKQNVYTDKTLQIMSDKKRGTTRDEKSNLKQSISMKEKYNSGEIIVWNKNKSKYDGKLCPFILWYYLNIEKLPYYKAANHLDVSRDYVGRKVKQLGIDKGMPLVF